MTTTRINICDLNANDVFTMSPDPMATVYVCRTRYFPGFGQGGCRVTYNLQSDGADMSKEWVMVKPGLTNVYVVN